MVRLTDEQQQVRTAVREQQGAPRRKQEEEAPRRKQGVGGNASWAGRFPRFGRSFSTCWVACWAEFFRDSSSTGKLCLVIRRDSFFVRLAVEVCVFPERCFARGVYSLEGGSFLSVYSRGLKEISLLEYFRRRFFSAICSFSFCDRICHC